MKRNAKADKVNSELRGLVYSKYPTISSFAKDIGWDRKKATRIVNLGQRPSAKDMEQMAECLDVKDVYSFVHIFLPSLSTKWTTFHVNPLDPLP